MTQANNFRGKAVTLVFASKLNGHEIQQQKA